MGRLLENRMAREIRNHSYGTGDPYPCVAPFPNMD